MPARVAMALQADGWWLRSEIVWHKPNPMPESCRDRPTSSHEKLFLLSRSAKYFYDAEAVRVPAGDIPKQYWLQAALSGGRGQAISAARALSEKSRTGRSGPRASAGANLRNVWNDRDFTASRRRTSRPSRPRWSSPASRRARQRRASAGLRRAVGAVKWQRDRNETVGRGCDKGRRDKQWPERATAGRTKRVRRKRARPSRPSGWAPHLRPRRAARPRHRARPLRRQRHRGPRSRPPAAQRHPDRDHRPNTPRWRRAESRRTPRFSP